MSRNVDELVTTAIGMFPDAHCELNYRNIYELIVAVVLSAQTTDARVNMVTKDLFEKYPKPGDLANATVEEVSSIIKSIGLYQTKARHIIDLAKAITDNGGIFPSSFEELIKLPGVGRKTANVVLSEGFGIPRIAVDTHVERVAKRLGIVSVDASVLEVEEALVNGTSAENRHLAHHAILFFGRYHCLAKKPNCLKCPLIDDCRYDKKHPS
jgi:endonuclease-3